MQNDINEISLTNFIEEIFEKSKNNSSYSVRCFRGHSNGSNKVEPSIMRNMKANAEQKIISELMQEAPSEFYSDSTMFDCLVRAQHYGLPTRLVDVTLNPLVGLYFACKGDEEKDGKLFIFNFDAERVKYPDSDTISLICNLSRLTDEERKQLKSPTNKDGEPVNLDKEQYNRMHEVKRLVEFVKSEKPHFKNEVKKAHLSTYWFAYPKKNNIRIIAQSGAFITAGLSNFLKPESSKKFDMEELIIPSSAKKRILKHLDLLNINERTMFPEIESVSKYIKEKYTKKLLETDGVMQAIKMEV